MEKRPAGREKRVSLGGNGVRRRGEALGGGRVGTGGRQENGFGQKGDSSGKRSSGRKSPFSFIVVLFIILMGGKNFLSGDNPGSNVHVPENTVNESSYQGGNVIHGWAEEEKPGSLNLEVAKEARKKRTILKGDGSDTVTLMVYMCGTDLESKYGMASSDLQEMSSAKLSNQVNLIVYTGGCRRWKNNVVSNKRNQIYQIKNGKMIPLAEDDGKQSMTDPDTLAGFLQYCKKHFPANRNELILWDHGGGSVSGYGYDEKNPYSGSMGLSAIRSALKKADMTFDFIGFDACLMATIENAFMLDSFADYLIASEETEPGIGWYYTNWLNALSANPSMPTVEIGKKIIDDYSTECAGKCRGQGTTLSIVDLAELSATVPEPFHHFSKTTTKLMANQQYRQVSDARYRAREYAISSKIDQIDLTHFALNMGTAEGKELAHAITEAVKYNRASENMVNSYGLSIYFPYQKTDRVDSAVRTYQSIGLDEEYSRCIESFAKMEVSGQAVSSGTENAFPSLSGNPTTSNMDSDGMMQVLQILFGGKGISLPRSIEGLDPFAIDFLGENSVRNETVTEYVTQNQLDTSHLIWQREGTKNVLKLTEEEWSMVHDLALNMFYDDGRGYVDLGTDNVFSFDEEGNLIGQSDMTWLSIDKNIVPYYYDSMVTDGDTYTITGHIPADYNGERANIVLLFDEKTPEGYIAGVSTDYKKDETETIAKNLVEVKKGDKIEPICDYYDYDGNYQDSYYLGEPILLGEDPVIENTPVGDGQAICTYRITDVYNQTYWTPEF